VTTRFEDLSELSEFHADVDGFSDRRRLLSELGVDCVAAPGDNDAVGYRAGMDLVRSVIGTSGE
jgi:hypothetical protein